VTTEPFDLLPEFENILDDDMWDDPDDEPITFEERLVEIKDLGSLERCEQSIRAIRNLDARKAALTAELDRLKAKLNAVENRRESVRNYLRSVMILMGTRKVKTTIATASISPGRERIIVDVEQIGSWPAEVVLRAVEEQPPKVRLNVLKELPADILASLEGVSLEIGEDVLAIR
jgi:uncharacterized small protein (DUF1192 family)